MADVLFLGGSKLRDYAELFSQRDPRSPESPNYQLPEATPKSLDEALRIIREWLGSAPPWLVMQDIIDDVSSLFFRSPAQYERRILVVTDDFFRDLGRVRTSERLYATSLEAPIRQISRTFPLGSFLFVFVTSQMDLYNSESVRLYRCGIDLVLTQYDLTKADSGEKSFVQGAVEQRLASVQRAREVRGREFIQSAIRFAIAFVGIPFAYFAVQLFSTWLWPTSWKLLIESKVGRLLIMFGVKWYILLLIFDVLVALLVSRYSFSMYSRRFLAVFILSIAAIGILGFVVCASLDVK